MKIYLCEFTKRKNSTSVPTGGTEVEAYLKENCTVENPDFEITGFSNFGNVNMIYTSGFGKIRYYYITERTIVNSTTCVFHCEEDVLATWKSSILSTVGFVERSASEKNTMISDGMAFPTNDFESWSDEGQVVPWLDITTGCYLVRFMNNRHGLDNYIITAEQLNSLLSFMYNDGSFKDLFADGWTKAVFNPAKYILSVQLLPISYDFITKNGIAGESEEIKLGYWNTGTNGHPLNVKTYSMFSNIAFENPIYADSVYGFWDSRFSKYYAQIPCVGYMEINPHMFNDANILEIKYFIDFITGSIVVKIGCDTLYSTITSQLGVGIEIAGITSAPVFEAVKSVLSGGGGSVSVGGSSSSSASTGSGMASTTRGGISATANLLAIAGTAMNVMQAPGTASTCDIGNNGSYAVNSAYNKPIGYCTAFDADIPHNSTEGLPLYANRVLSKLSGYVKCRNFSVKANCTDREATAINMYLNGGAYIE